MKFEERIKKVKILPTRDCEAGYGPARGFLGQLCIVSMPELARHPISNPKHTTVFAGCTYFADVGIGRRAHLDNSDTNKRFGTSVTFLNLQIKNIEGYCYQ